MSGRPNKKMFKTMVKKHGSEEAARAWFRGIGAQGGAVGRTGGFDKKATQIITIKNPRRIVERDLFISLI